MSTRLDIIAGEDRDFPLQCWLEGGLSTPTFAADDILTAFVSPGEGQASLFLPAVAWWTAPDPAGAGTQTGFDQGQVLLSVAAADSTTLEPETSYAVEVWRQDAATARRQCIWRGALVAGYAAGTGRPRLPTYGTYQDMLDFGPWCRYVQDAAADEAGFYDQRLEARVAIDDLIVRSFRGSTLYPFGTAGVPWRLWSGWAGPWRSTMPSYWLRDQLWGGMLVPPATVAAAGTGYDVPPLVVAPDPPYSTLPQVARRQQTARLIAVLDGMGGVGAISVGDPGFGYIPGSTLTLSIIPAGGTGSGAAATVGVSAGALIVRDQVRRLATFKALSLLGLAQMGNNPQHLAFGRYFQSKFSEELSSFTAELDLNASGMPQIAIPCSTTNTIYV
jgi:hypothetical protein